MHQTTARTTQPVAAGRRAAKAGPKAAAAAGLTMMAALAGAPGHATVIDFDAPAIAGAVAEAPGDSFAGDGVTFRTVRLSGTVALGATITLADVNGDMRLYRDATAISGEQLAGPALGGSSNDLLMSFAAPLASLAVTSDDAVETANTIRLIALAETATAGRYRVVDFVEALDDAVASPANRLALAPSENFSIALFEIRTQQEAFDDLTFTFAGGDPVVDPPPPPPPPPVGVAEIPEPGGLALFAGMLGAATAARRMARAGVRVKAV
ncbi:MAG: hypothetical protein JNK67_08260 [Alphaproteobacteria bacterium]|nr:hypothetical protein [Alphaproteobacteria bacterium]